MKRSSFGLQFYCRQSKVNKNGQAPIEVSISVNGVRTFIALPRKMQPSDFGKQMASRKNNDTKVFCNDYEALINDAVTNIIESKKMVTANAIKNYILNGGDNSSMLSSLIRDYLDLLKMKNATVSTYRKYEMTFDRIMKQVGDKDIAEITNLEIQQFLANLGKDYGAGTIRSYATKLKSLFIFAMQNGKLKTSPWVGVKIANPTPKIETITEEEYKVLSEKRFDIDRVERVRKMFVLACNCGLAYCDVQDLKPSDIQEKDGKVFVEKERQKTGVTFTAVILKDGQEILQGLDTFADLKISNQKVNSYLKEVADLCGIKKNLTFHKARHFYITHLMRMGLPPQIVQRTAGHSKISMTLRYTHLLQDDVLAAFK